MSNRPIDSTTAKEDQKDKPVSNMWVGFREGHPTTLVVIFNHRVTEADKLWLERAINASPK